MVSKTTCGVMIFVSTVIAIRFLVYLIQQNQFSPVSSNRLSRHQSPLKKYKCEALLLMLSTQDSVEMRNSIRNGWLSSMNTGQDPLNFRYKFIVGRSKTVKEDLDKKLNEEIYRYNDITVLPFIDDYWNLTVKVSVMFKWATSGAMGNCRLLFKVDEDVYIKAEPFKQMVRAIPLGNVYGGHVYDQLNRISKPLLRSICRGSHVFHVLLCGRVIAI